MFDKVSRELIEEIKKGNELAFYNSTVWRKKREEIKKLQNNECQLCKREGKVGACECVHHILHLKEYPEFALSNDNLMCLCNKHHNEVHPEKGGGMTKADLNKRPKGFKERW